MSEDLFSTSTPSVDSDPAAEFLAREQATLAGLNDDLNLNATSSTPNGTVTNEINDVPPTNGILSDSNESTGPTAVSMPIEPKVEPEKIKKWREEQEKMLLAKDARESQEKDDLKAQAKKELDDWYVKNREHLEKSRKANRISEKEWIADRDASDESSGELWDKITKMCDFNPKSSKTTKDTSRLRSILLQLKSNPLASSSS